MKISLHAKLTKIVSLALLLNLVSAITAFAALHGAYTINASGPATASNYKTFLSAVSDMASGTRPDGGPVQGSGVSAAVTFTVAPGTYAEQLTVPAITGASAINTITFDGQNPATCFLNGTPNSTVWGLITFNACSFVTVKNFSASTTYAGFVPSMFGAAFVGTAAGTPANNNTLQNCIISVLTDFSTSNYSQYSLAFVGAANSDGTYGFFNNNTVTGCTLSGGCWDGVLGYGTNGASAGNVIKNNTISGGIIQATVDLENFDNIKLLNNNISALNTPCDIAVYIYACTPTATDYIDISGNKINVYQEGIYFQSNAGTAAQPSRISNNFIYSSLSNSTDAIFVNTSNSYVNVYHNSLNFSAPSTSYTYKDDGSNNNVNIRDNIFSYSATSGAGYPFNLTGASAELVSFNNNIFYNAASTTLGSVNSTLYTTTAVGGGAFNTASFSSNPNFRSATNLHIPNPSLAQLGANVGVTADIDGETRPATPHIGADDFPSTGNNDLSVTLLSSPSTSTAAGLQTIAVQVYNTGANTVTSGNVNYIINGGAVVTQALPSSIPSGSSTNFTFTTAASLLAGLNSIKVYTSLPNGVTDSYTPNDTLTTSWYSALTGTYTLNGSLAASATNFVSFTSATAAVNNGVVIGATTINVAAGTYTEQIEFTANTGTSAANTVTFNGGSTANVTLQYSGTYGNMHTIRLNGCSYINFINMTITTTNTTYGWPVHFYGNGTNYNRFAHCNISVPATTTENLVPIIAIGAEGTVSGFSVGGCNTAFNRIDTCIINKGIRGIDWNGTGDNVNSVGNIFQGNTITNTTAYGIVLSATYSSKVWNNTITMPNSGTGVWLLNNGISAGATPDFMDVSFNTITGFTGGQSFAGGIAEAPCTGSAALHNRISNNIVVTSTAATNAICLDLGAGFTGEQPSGVASYTDMNFNTLIYQGTGTGSGNCVYWYNAFTNDNSSFNNNICAVLSTIGTPYPLYSSSPLLTCDYNIFYTTNANTTIANIGGTGYTAGTLIGGGGYNTHSQITNPNFVGGSNYHITAQCPRGVAIAGYNTDIDGDTRYNPPTIGADEIPAASPIGTPAAISGPTTPCQGQGGYVYSIPALTNATSYIWTLPTGATITAGSNTNSITITFSTIASPGNFTVEGSSSCGGGPVGAPFPITLNSAPTLSSSLTPPAFCTGTPFSYTPTSATGGATFNWSRSLTAGINNAANSGSNNPNETLNLTTPTGGAIVATYAYTINSPAGCSFSQNVTVTVNNLPTISFTNLPIVYGCAGGPGGTLTASGASTYAWLPTSTLNITSGAIVIASPTTNTTYTATGTNANGCVNTNTAAITVIPSGSPLSGLYTIDNVQPVSSTNFQSFSSAIATLNCLGASVAVTFTVTAGQTFSEQASIITYTNSSHFPIKFVTSNSAGTDPVLSVASGTAVLQINGGNNYTFDGIDFNGTTASTTNGLFFQGLSSSGCQNNVVKNCKLSNTTTALIRLTSAAVSSPTANSNNSFFNNTLTTSQNGIVFTGISGFPDNGNEIGTNAAISAKVSTITAINVAGGAAIIIRYQTGFAAYKNTIDNTGTTVAGAFTGILFDQNVSGNSAEIYDNKIVSLTNSTATVLTGIQIAGGNGTFPTVNIYGNTIGVDATHLISSTSTGVVSGILATTGVGGIHDNILNSITSTGGAAYGICEASSTNTASAAAYDIYNNTLNGTISSTTGTPIVGIAVNTNVGGRNIYSNYISTVKSTGNSTESVYGIFFQGGVASVTNSIYGNSINAISSASTSSASPVYGINVSSASLASIINNVNNNSVSNITTTTTVASNIYGIYVVPTSSTATGVENIDYNTVNTVAATSVTTGLENVYGIFTGVANASSNIFNNKIYTIKNTTTGTATTTPTGITAGLHIVSGVTNTIYNNMIYDIESYASAGTTVIPSARGISIFGVAATVNNLYYNTVYLTGTSTNASNYSAALFYTLTSATVLYNNNIFVNLYNLTTTGTKAVAIFRNINSSYTTTNPSTSCDRNLVWAGAGAKNFLYWDGTTSCQVFGPVGTAGTYQKVMTTVTVSATREANSVTGDPVFVNTTAPPNEDVHINLSCSASSGSPVLHAGIPITTPNINFDFDGNARNAGAAGSGTAPAIGADEVGGGAGAAGIITGPIAPVCAGIPVTFNVPAILNATGYNWVFPSTTSLNTTTSTPTVIVTFPSNTASGIQTVTVQGTTVSCGNGTVSSPFPVSIIAAPTAFTVIPTGPTCSSATIGLSNSQTNTVGYQLKLNGVSSGSPLTGVSGALSFGVQSTVGTYTVVATSGAGCTAGMSNSTSIIITPAPTAPSGPASRCFGSGTSVYTSTAASANTYNWTVSGTGNSISGTGSSATVSWGNLFVGNATISVTATNACGTSSPAVTTTVLVGGLSGTYTINSGVSGAGNLYPNTNTFNSFSTAIAALTSCGLAGPVVFDVISGTNYSENPLTIFFTSNPPTSTNTLTFIKSGGGANPLINVTGTSGTDAGLKIEGASFTTFDGIDIKDAGTSQSNWIEVGIAVVRATATQGCQHDTIRNCKITMNTNNDWSTNTALNNNSDEFASTGILQTTNSPSLTSGTDLWPTSTAGTHQFNAYINNTFTTVGVGIELRGTSGYFQNLAPAPFIPDGNNYIGNNTISAGTANAGAEAYGILVGDQYNSLRITGNTITASDNQTDWVYGINIGDDGIQPGEVEEIDHNTVTINSTAQTGEEAYAIRIESGTQASVSIHDNTISNCNVTGVALPLVSAGSSATTQNIYNNTIRNNTCDVEIRGIEFSGGTTANIYNNQIFTNSTTGSSGIVSGIYNNGGSVTGIVYNNFVADLKASTGANVYGIYFNTTTHGKLYYNSIYLNQTSGISTGLNTMGIYIGNSVATTDVDVRNNLVVNSSTPGTSATGRTIALSLAGLNTTSPKFLGYAATSDYNDYSAGTPGAKNLIFYSASAGVSDQALAGGFQTRVASRDAHSITINPVFTSATDLHKTNMTYPGYLYLIAGQPIATYTTDIDGDTRNATTPDIGADEFVACEPSLAGAITGAVSVCQNDNNVSYSVASVAGATGYNWTLPNGAFIEAGTNTNTINVFFSPTASSGTVSVSGADICGNGLSSFLAVTVKTSPPVLVTPNNAVCTGSTSVLLAASGAATYVWAPTANLTPSAGTSATETAQISQLTFYTVTGTGSNSCTASIIVPVATVATGGIISPNFSIICSGTTKTLTVTGAAGHDYQWQISTDNSTWTNITGATNTTYTTASGDGTTNKFYRLLAQSNSCWNVASTTAEVDVSIPNIVVGAGNITDNSLILNWSPTGTGNYTISYSGPSSATLTSVTPAKTITGLTANGTYSITVTQTGVGCAASGTVTGVTTLCAMPTGVTLSSPANSQILVSWTGVVGADYRVYYRPLFSYNTYFTKDVSNVSSVLLTKQGNNNLYASTTYEVYVSRLDCPATGAVGQGTSPTNVTTLPNVSCVTPSIDSVRSLCPVQIEVFIHDNTVNQYNVFIQRITPTILAVNSYGVTGTYFTVNVPYSGDQFLVAVEAKCGGALSNLYIWPGNVTIKPLCTSPNNLVLSNPTCHGFTASWNSDQCLSNSASGYELDLRVQGTLNYNSYGVPLPANGIGPNKLIGFVTSGRTYQVFVRSIYNCSGYVTYGPSSQVQTITTLSSGCRDEEITQPEETKPAVQQYSGDNQEVFSLYPNPNNGEFVVDLSRYSNEEDAVRIEVINMIGQTVVTHLTTINGGHMSEFINLPNGTAAGTYMVRLTAGKNVYTAKINVSK